MATTNKNTKANTSASAKAITEQAYFTTMEVAKMLGVEKHTITTYVRNHTELCPKKKNNKGMKFIPLLLLLFMFSV